MIVRPRPNWLRFLFVWRGSVIGKILPQLAITSGIALLVTLAHEVWLKSDYGLTAVPFTLVGIALAIFLGFRNSVSYERYWEARTLWGGLLNHSRALARQILSLSEANQATQTRLIHALAACVWALRDQLRGQPIQVRALGLLPEQWQESVQQARFAPIMILQHVSGELRALRLQRRLLPVLAPSLEQHVDQLNHMVGGCERIASTPMPFAYSLILHRTVYVYSLLLPFGLVNLVGVATPLIVAFITYTFFSLEALAEELEDPFGDAPNDLALDAMSLNIEITLRELLGEADLPAAPQPKDFVLL